MERLSPEHKEIIAKKLVYHEKFIEWLEKPDEIEGEAERKASILDGYINPKPPQRYKGVIVSKGS